MAHSYSDPCTLPAHLTTPSGGHRSWEGASWPHIHLKETQMDVHYTFSKDIIKNNVVVLSKSYPSFWEADRHPVCTGPPEHCTALSEPKPSGTQR